MSLFKYKRPSLKDKHRAMEITNEEIKEEIKKVKVETKKKKK